MGELYDGLKKGLEEVDAILSGEVVAPYTSVHDGYIRIEERVNGKVTWRLSDAVKTLKVTSFSEVESPAEFFRIVREILGQTQRAMADIYGVSVRTYEEWETDTRPLGPRSATKVSLINLMAQEPAAVIRTARKKPEVGFLS